MVETATFGLDWVTTRTCTEQVIDLWNTLHYLGVPIEDATIMFGNNESVVITASAPCTKLSKHHNALSFHWMREVITASIMRFCHCVGKINPADILSKHWDYPSIWPMLKPLLFW